MREEIMSDGLVQERNVENLRWPTFQSIDQTFNRFGRASDQRLQATTTTTHGAVRAAMDRKANSCRAK